MKVNRGSLWLDLRGYQKTNSSSPKCSTGFDRSKSRIFPANFVPKTLFSVSIVVDQTRNTATIAHKLLDGTCVCVRVCMCVCGSVHSLISVKTMPLVVPTFLSACEVSSQATFLHLNSTKWDNGLVVIVMCSFPMNSPPPAQLYLPSINESAATYLTPAPCENNSHAQLCSCGQPSEPKWLTSPHLQPICDVAELRGWLAGHANGTCPMVP